MAKRVQPDRAALEIAHSRLSVAISLEDMLKHPAFRPILENVARLHMARRARTDSKKLQANDRE